MPALRSAIGLALIVVSVLASSAFAADPPRSIPASLAPVAGYWDDRFDLPFYERWMYGSTAVIHDAVIFNGELYVAGHFSDGDASGAAYALDTIARWDGRKWTNLAKWRSNATMWPIIYAMEVHENSLYVTGSFSQVGSVAVANIARWDGTTWHALGSGLGGESVRGLSLASWKGDLYVGGSFSSAGGVAANNIARWDGATWHALGAGLNANPDSDMAGLALEATPWGLYVGGAFDRAGDQAMQALTRWDGARWSAVIPGLTGYVMSMDWHAGQLYVGGRFALASAPEQTHNTLRWDGAQAQLMTAGPNPQAHVQVVRSVDGELYAGFWSGLYRWDGGAWQPFGPPIQPAGSPMSVLAMDIIAFNGQLHLVGALESNSTTGKSRYAMALNGGEWLAVGHGPLVKTSAFGADPQAVSGMVIINGDLYISASTIHADGRYLGNVARWDGAAWSSLSVGPALPLMTMGITALATDGSTLYAAGAEYDPALGRDRNFIFRRDAGAWTTLSNDFNGRVAALAWSDGVLYAGGDFTAVGATSVRGVARWNGTAWSGLGGGLLYNVDALAVHAGTVYAAGSTAASGGLPTIARWNNGAWSSIASALIYALAVSPAGELYAGGDFTTIGGVAANSVARWSNGAWAPLGAGVSGSQFGPIVQALGFAPDGVLYVGGRFQQAGGLSVSNIARYDGQWSALGGGLTGLRFGGTVNYLTFSGQQVYAGGEIHTADGRISESLAIWRPGAAPQAAADAATTERGQAVDIAVLANDSDADQDTLTITTVTTPSQGAVAVSGGTIRYTPEAGYVGADSFGYTISDGRGGTATTMVTVVVSAPITKVFVPLLTR